MTKQTTNKTADAKFQEWAARLSQFEGAYERELGVQPGGIDDHGDLGVIPDSNT